MNRVNSGDGYQDGSSNSRNIGIVVVVFVVAAAAAVVVIFMFSCM